MEEMIERYSGKAQVYRAGKDYHIYWVNLIPSHGKVRFDVELTFEGEEVVSCKVKEEINALPDRAPCGMWGECHRFIMQGEGERWIPLLKSGFLPDEKHLLFSLTERSKSMYSAFVEISNMVRKWLYSLVHFFYNADEDDLDALSITTAYVALGWAKSRKDMKVKVKHSEVDVLNGLGLKIKQCHPILGSYVISDMETADQALDVARQIIGKEAQR